MRCIPGERGSFPDADVLFLGSASEGSPLRLETALLRKGESKKCVCDFTLPGTARAVVAESVVD